MKKKGTNNEPKFMNSSTPGSCTGKVPQKSNSIVLLYHQPVPFHKQCTFFLNIIKKRRASILGMCMLHLLAPGVPLSLSCFFSQQTYIVDYITLKTHGSPHDCFFLEKPDDVVLLHSSVLHGSPSNMK